MSDNLFLPLFFIVIVIIALLIFATVKKVFSVARKNTQQKQKRSNTIPVIAGLLICAVGFGLWIGSTRVKNSDERTNSPENAVYDFSEKGMKEYDPSNLKINTGQVKKLAKAGGTVYITVKIDSLLSNKQTIEQNYLNVDKLIKDNGFNTVPEELKYTAVADATDGTETEAMSFTVRKSVIIDVYDGKVDWLADLPTLVDDLRINPSLIDT